MKMISATGEDETMRTDYEQQMEALRIELTKLKGLMEPHPEKSERRGKYYAQYCALEDERERLRAATPALIALDGKITAADRALRNADNATHQGSGWSRLAVASGTLGLVLVLLSLTWLPTGLMPATGALLLVIAGGSLLASIRSQRAAEDRATAAQGHLWALCQEREELLAGKYDVAAIEG